MSNPKQDEREKIVSILKNYRGITGNMDLTIDSALVVELAAAQERAVAETRRIDYQEFLSIINGIVNNSVQVKEHFEHRVEALAPQNRGEG